MKSDDRACHLRTSQGHELTARLSRRRALVTAIAATFPLTARAQSPHPLPAILPSAASSIVNPGLIVAGGPGTQSHFWSDVIAGPLSDALGSGQALDITASSGRDGVTGANLFDARVTPDGATALLVPGAAILASLAGDPRAHFDYTRWVPVTVGQSRTLVVGRADFHRSLRNLFRDRPVRVAVSVPDGIELPTLLALTLLGQRPVPVAGFATSSAAIDALKNNVVDVIQIEQADDPALQSQIAALAQSGFQALFSLQTGSSTPHHSDDVPSFPDLYQSLRRKPPSGPVHEALSAISAAASIDVALVLPMLTPPALVSEWRRAAVKISTLSTVQAAAGQHHTALFTGPDAVTAFNATNPSLTAQLALRRWIATKMPDWRLG